MIRKRDDQSAKDAEGMGQNCHPPAVYRADQPPLIRPAGFPLNQRERLSSKHVDVADFSRR